MRRPIAAQLAHSRRLRLRERLRHEAGFTLIEMLIATLILAIVSAPIAAVLITGSKASKASRALTAADQLATTQMESIRALPYSQIGLVNGNPNGVVVKTQSLTLANGTQVTMASAVSYVSDPIPTAYVTNADYKKIAVTVTRISDSRILAQQKSFVSSASQPALSGTAWVQVNRTIVDAVTTSPLVGASVNLTGGPKSVNLTDATNGAGNVIFPALDSATSGTPTYSVVPTLSGYSVFPDDLAPMLPENVPSNPGYNVPGTIRMYKPVTLTVNVQNSSGVAYTSGATVSVDSSRCGVSTVSVPVGQSSVSVSTCAYANGKTISLVPNVAGQVPAFDKYNATAWSTTGNLWGSGTPVIVPSSYPTVLSQTLNVKLSAAAFTGTKTLTVTVTKGGSADANARVEVTGGPVTGGVALYGTSNGSGIATFTIPVSSTATTFTINANDMGATKGTGSVSVSSASSNPSVTVGIS